MRPAAGGAGPDAASRRPEVRAFLARIGDLSAGWRLMGVTGLGVVASIGAVLAFDRGLVAKGVLVAVALTTGLFLLTLMISVLCGRIASHMEG